MLQHYRLVEQIGQGGMGVVWKALDTILDREVAIKLLPPALATDPERLQRFEREAKLLATLNHPKIAAIYGLHQADDLRFIAMEMVPGEDLSQRLDRGPMAMDEVLDVGRQVAEALEAAHDQGVIHRDLKPANVKMTPDGAIKVLDLGLAKALLLESSSDPGRLSLSPTMTSAGTVAGTLLGTAAYMSPEQARGKAVDRRADVWSFGCLLYEMAIGKAAFRGETISETLASVLRDEVDLTMLPAEMPEGVKFLVSRCLERDPKMRLRDIGEARIALSPEGTSISVGMATAHGPMIGTPSVAPAPAARGGSSKVAWAVAGIAIIVAVLAGWAAVSRTAGPISATEIRATIRPPKGQIFEAYGAHSGAVTISPDGTRVTFVSGQGDGEERPSLYVRSLGSETAQPLPDTAGATFPFWSPDSRQIAFFLGGKLKKIDLEGGAPLTICNASEGRGGNWSQEGVILFTPDTQSPIMRVSAAGGEPTPVTTIDVSRLGESSHRYPVFLPDGNRFFYLRASHAAAPQDPVNSIWIGSLDSDETFELMQSTSNVTYAQGHLFWQRDRFLMARQFDPESLEFQGEPFVVGEDLVYQANYWRASFGVSDRGPIVFQGGLASTQYLAWYDREGEEVGRIGEPSRYGAIRISPDGRTLAATVLDENSGAGDIWTFDLARNVGSRLTFDDANEQSPVWSPDGTRIAFQSNRQGTTGDLFVQSTSGQGAAELLFATDALDTPQDWSSDGKYLAVDRGIGKNDVWIVPLDGSEPFGLIETEFDDGYSRFSPDARWIAYISNQSGRFELYLTRFPSGEGKWQLSKGGADWLLGWNDDGTELYYLDLEGALSAVRVQLGERVVADLPRRLFPTRSEATWASSGDGERFVLGVPDDPDQDYPITLIVNWQGKR
jgi:Tol biopolymer transport system component